MYSFSPLISNGIRSDDFLEYKRRKRRGEIDSINNDIINFFDGTNLNHYGMKFREGQINMAMDIVECFRDGQNLIIEAGVGIGKTFAYLFPLLRLNNIMNEQMIIATSTIALQEQLEEDAEKLQKMLGTKVEVTVVKGQGNYICKDRLNNNLHESSLFEAIKQESDKGFYDKGKFTVKVPSDEWEQIRVKEFNQKYCSRRCRYYANCYYYNQRTLLKKTSGIIICNQDLLVAHFKHEKNIFSSDNIGLIVIDEAHNFESKVRNVLTQAIDKHEIVKQIKEARKGLPTGFSIDSELDKVESKLDLLFEKILMDCNFQDKHNKHEDIIEKYDVKREGLWEETISNLASSLYSINETISLGFGFDEHRIRDSITKAAENISVCSELFQKLNSVPDDFVYWAARELDNVVLYVCPRKEEISRWVNRNFFPNKGLRSVLTSATLRNSCTGELSNQYSYLIDILGFPKDKAGYIGDAQESPFDYDTNAIIYIADKLPHPTKQRNTFIKKGTEKIIDLLKLTNGRSLILFTSKTDLDEVYEILRNKNLPFNILREGNGHSHRRIVQEFKKDVDSVLLGTGSYWEGIDVEGEALTSLIIFRLPFPVPDPIINDKCANSMDKFNEILLPEMIIRLKQGIGRLIRSETDKGIVSIIDSRLSENSRISYKNKVFSSLPIHNKTSDFTVVADFYKRITSA